MNKNNILYESEIIIVHYIENFHFVNDKFLPKVSNYMWKNL
jgi:hypothetical protein